ncbi:MAG: phosphoglucomutase/phosphomannomutase family protein [Blastocatellia bacterium]
MIRFGTSGWRAIIADQFTDANVRICVHAIANVIARGDRADRQVVIGNDTRFMSERFVHLAGALLAERGIATEMCDRPTPTPVIAFTVGKRQAAGAINFTASHNPPEYLGLKFSSGDGAPALPEVTREIEDEIRRVIETGAPAGTNSPAPSVEIDPSTDYLADLATKVDLDVIASSGLRIAYDPLWGTGRGYLDKALADRGVTVSTLHDWRDVYFGGRSPEPNETNCADLIASVRSGEFDLGLSTDGDGDRFGIIDRDGSFVAANDVLALLVDYLIETRAWDGDVARSVATSHFVDRVAAKHGRRVIETPVGFKYIGELINENKIVLGGEESAGLSIRGHVPEKDGILACLLVAEAVARRGATVAQMLASLRAELGTLVNRRIGVRLSEEQTARLRTRLESEDPSEIGGRRVERVDRTDGAKFLLENEAWVLMRPSGTEPLVRIYAEARTEEEVEVLLESGREFVSR